MESEIKRGILNDHVQRLNMYKNIVQTDENALFAAITNGTAMGDSLTEIHDLQNKRNAVDNVLNGSVTKTARAIDNLEKAEKATSDARKKSTEIRGNISIYKEAAAKSMSSGYSDCRENIRDLLRKIDPSLESKIAKAGNSTHELNNLLREAKAQGGLSSKDLHDLNSANSSRIKAARQEKKNAETKAAIAERLTTRPDSDQLNKRRKALIDAIKKAPEGSKQAIDARRKLNIIDKTIAKTIKQQTVLEKKQDRLEAVKADCENKANSAIIRLNKDTREAIPPDAPCPPPELPPKYKWAPMKIDPTMLYYTEKAAVQQLFDESDPEFVKQQFRKHFGITLGILQLTSHRLAQDYAMEQFDKHLKRGVPKELEDSIVAVGGHGCKRLSRDMKTDMGGLSKEELRLAVKQAKVNKKRGLTDDIYINGKKLDDRQKKVVMSYIDDRAKVKSQRMSDNVQALSLYLDKRHDGMSRYSSSELRSLAVNPLKARKYGLTAEERQVAKLLADAKDSNYYRQGGAIRGDASALVINKFNSIADGNCDFINAINRVNGTKSRIKRTIRTHIAIKKGLRSIPTEMRGSKLTKLQKKYDKLGKKIVLTDKQALKKEKTKDKIKELTEKLTEAPSLKDIRKNNRLAKWENITSNSTAQNLRDVGKWVGGKATTGLKKVGGAAWSKISPTKLGQKISTTATNIAGSKAAHFVTRAGSRLKSAKEGVGKFTGAIAKPFKAVSGWIDKLKKFLIRKLALPLLGVVVAYIILMAILPPITGFISSVPTWILSALGWVEDGTQNVFDMETMGDKLMNFMLDYDVKKREEVAGNLKKIKYTIYQNPLDCPYVSKTKFNEAWSKYMEDKDKYEKGEIDEFPPLPANFGLEFASPGYGDGEYNSTESASKISEESLKEKKYATLGGVYIKVGSHDETVNGITKIVPDELTEEQLIEAKKEIDRQWKENNFPEPLSDGDDIIDQYLAADIRLTPDIVTSDGLNYYLSYNPSTVSNEIRFYYTEFGSAYKAYQAFFNAIVAQGYDPELYPDGPQDMDGCFPTEDNMNFITKYLYAYTYDYSDVETQFTPYLYERDEETTKAYAELFNDEPIVNSEQQADLRKLILSMAGALFDGVEGVKYDDVEAYVKRMLDIAYRNNLVAFEPYDVVDPSFGITLNSNTKMLAALGQTYKSYSSALAENLKEMHYYQAFEESPAFNHTYTDYGTLAHSSDSNMAKGRFLTECGSANAVNNAIDVDTEHSLTCINPVQGVKYVTLPERDRMQVATEVTTKTYTGSTEFVRYYDENWVLVRSEGDESYSTSTQTVSGAAQTEDCWFNGISYGKPSSYSTEVTYHTFHYEEVYEPEVDKDGKEVKDENGNPVMKGTGKYDFIKTAEGHYPIYDMIEYTPIYEDDFIVKYSMTKEADYKYGITCGSTIPITVNNIYYEMVIDENFDSLKLAKGSDLFSNTSLLKDPAGKSDSSITWASLWGDRMHPTEILEKAMNSYTYYTLSNWVDDFQANLWATQTEPDEKLMRKAVEIVKDAPNLTNDYRKFLLRCLETCGLSYFEKGAGGQNGLFMSAYYTDPTIRNTLEHPNAYEGIFDQYPLQKSADATFWLYYNLSADIFDPRLNNTYITGTKRLALFDAPVKPQPGNNAYSQEKTSRIYLTGEYDPQFDNGFNGKQPLPNGSSQWAKGRLYSLTMGIMDHDRYTNMWTATYYKDNEGTVFAYYGGETKQWYKRVNNRWFLMPNGYAAALATPVASIDGAKLTSYQYSKPYYFTLFGNDYVSCNGTYYRLVGTKWEKDPGLQSISRFYNINESLKNNKDFPYYQNEGSIRVSYESGEERLPYTSAYNYRWKGNFTGKSLFRLDLLTNEWSGSNIEMDSEYDPGDIIWKKVDKPNDKKYLYNTDNHGYSFVVIIGKDGETTKKNGKYLGESYLVIRYDSGEKTFNYPSMAYNAAKKEWVQERELKDNGKQGKLLYYTPRGTLTTEEESETGWTGPYLTSLSSEQIYKLFKDADDDKSGIARIAH